MSPAKLPISRSPCLTIPPVLSPTSFLSNFKVPSAVAGPGSAVSDPSVSVNGEIANELKSAVAGPGSAVSPEIDCDEINQREDSNSEAQIPQFEQKGLVSQVITDQTSDDGYNWRKYGQKLVKGSEFSRGYYKCTHSNCEVKKLFDRTPEGQITGIIYKGTHDHPKPQPNRRHPAASMVSALEEKSERAPLLTQQEAKPRNMFGQSAHNNEGRSAVAGPGSAVSPEIDCDEINQREDSNSEAQIPQFEQKGLVFQVITDRTSDDGYNWRKYGQKLVKGSEFSRSYYRCTHSNCEVKKLFERTPEGQITGIIYKGTHSHPKPQPNRRLPAGSMVSALEEKSEIAPLLTQQEAKPRNMFGQSAHNNEGRSAVAGPGSAVSPEIDCDEINQREDSNSEAQIPQFEQKGLVFQVITDRTSDDGYNWRKYGQKLVKGSEFSRSYYRCTHSNCEVKKLFKRTPEGQITGIIYKGTHGHPKPQPNRRLPAGSMVSALEEKSEIAPLLTQQEAKPRNMFGQSAHNNEGRSAVAGPGSAVSPEIDCDEINQREDSNSEAQIPQFEQKGLVFQVITDRTSDDGYNWRKYGQKLVKGSEFSRSYYRCTHSNCEVKKLFERTPEGQITGIIYKGTHGHPKPQPNRRLPDGSMVSALEEKSEIAPLLTQQEAKPTNMFGQSAHNNEGRSPELPSCVANENSGEGCLNIITDDADDEDPFAKRRKIESGEIDYISVVKPIREPRVVQTVSEVDILDDGYHWRKYGQKVVRGNSNPRSYYKCTHLRCPVRKHVERASHDPKSVITTYEGKHNHKVPKVPTARNSSHDTVGHVTHLATRGGSVKSSKDQQGSVSIFPSYVNGGNSMVLYGSMENHSHAHNIGNPPVNHSSNSCTLTINV